MDIVIDIHDGVVLEPCPCCGSPAKLVALLGDSGYTAACSSGPIPVDNLWQATAIKTIRCPLSSTDNVAFHFLTTLKVISTWNTYARALSVHRGHVTQG